MANFFFPCCRRRENTTSVLVPQVTVLEENGEHIESGIGRKADHGKGNADLLQVEVDMSFDEDEKQREDWQADENASCCSRFLFLWFYPIIRLANQRELEHEDLGRVASLEDPTRWRDRFTELWEKEQRKKGKSSLWPVLISIVGYDTFWICSILSIVRATLWTSYPFVTKAIIDSFQEGSELDTAGYAFYVTLLIVLPLFGSLCESHVQFRGRRASVHLYESFTIAIYNKSLKLSAGKFVELGFLDHLIRTN